MSRSYLPHQERVFEEKSELDKKIEKLSVFADTPTFRQIDITEQERLSRQLDAMRQYSSILSERTAAF